MKKSDGGIVILLIVTVSFLLLLNASMTYNKQAEIVKENIKILKEKYR